MALDPHVLVKVRFSCPVAFSAQTYLCLLLRMRKRFLNTSTRVEYRSAKDFLCHILRQAVDDLQVLSKINSYSKLEDRHQPDGKCDTENLMIATRSGH